MYRVTMRNYSGYKDSRSFKTKKAALEWYKQFAGGLVHWQVILYHNGIVRLWEAGETLSKELQNKFRTYMRALNK